MIRCPKCLAQLEQDRIGGTPASPALQILLCPECWICWTPAEVAAHERDQRHLHSVPDQRRDLA